MSTMPKTDIYYIEVLGKALEILDVFARTGKPTLTLHEVSQLTRLSKNTVFRVLYTLGEHGYIVKRGHDYQLGPRAADLGHAKTRPRDLLAAAGPRLDELRNQFGETVNLGVLDGAQIRYVDVRESRHRFRLAERVGGSDYLHCTALGKATLAFLPFDEVRRLLKQEGMLTQTPNTITTISALKAELAVVREQGYALDREESMEGAFCVAAPILDREGAPVAAISISGPTTRFNSASTPAASRALMDAATEIRSAMGYA
jgi:IclR family acetate operon transcriptional repressor